MSKSYYDNLLFFTPYVPNPLINFNSVLLLKQRQKYIHHRNLEAPFIKWIMKKDEIDRKIKQFKFDLDFLKAEALLKIEELENEDYKILLVLKYLKFQAIKEIASKLYVSVSTVKSWHIKALELIII